jgi:hypothetical protein
MSLLRMVVVYFHILFSANMANKLELIVEFQLQRRINLEFLGVHLVVSLFFSWRIATWPLRLQGGWWNWKRGGPSAKNEKSHRVGSSLGREVAGECIWFPRKREKCELVLSYS